MKKLVLFAVTAALLVPAAMSSADVNIHIGVPVPPPPHVVVPVPPAPPARAVVVLPPPPPAIVIAPGPPSYWFWDDGRETWFYYDVDRRPHYVRKHVYADDGRHYCIERGKWRAAKGDMGKHKGWHKKEKREHKRGRGRD